MRLLPEMPCPACLQVNCVLASDDQRTCEECGAWWEEEEVIVDEETKDEEETDEDT